MLTYPFVYQTVEDHESDEGNDAMDNEVTIDEVILDIKRFES